MAKLEKEIKVLDIDLELMKQKLDNIGAYYKDKKEQKIYVYDIPTLYYRYLEIRELLKSKSMVIRNANLKKLKVLLIEYQDLISEDELNHLKESFSLNCLEEILNKDINEIRRFLDNPNVEKLFKKFMINENKWLRLRQSNDKVILTSKHILEKNNTNIQKVI